MHAFARHGVDVTPHQDDWREKRRVAMGVLSVGDPCDEQDSVGKGVAQPRIGKPGLTGRQ
eukprot:6274031-Alexandrium_andersonii.AAC.1